MKILLLHSSLQSKTGGNRLVYEYYKRSKNKIKILIWYYNKSKTFDFDEKDIVKIYNEKFDRIFRGFLLKGFFTLLNTLRKFYIDDFDLLLISTGGIVELILANQDFNIPKVAYAHTVLRAAHKHGIYWNLKYRFNKLSASLYKAAINTYNYLEKKSWKKIDYAIFNSELSRKRAFDKKLIDKEKTDVIYPGADLHGFYNENPEDYFLYVARIGLSKRQDILIKAFARLIKEYPNYKLYLVAGSLGNRKYYSKILKLIKEIKNLEKINLEKIKKIIL